MAKNLNDFPPGVQIGVLGGIAVIVAGLVFWYYVQPLSSTRDKLQKQVKELHAQNVKNLAFEQERTEYLNRIAQLEKQLDTLRSIVPDDAVTEQFVKMVADTAVESHTNLRTFVAQALVPHDIYTEMPYTLRLDGTYFGLLAFFDRLARQQRIVSVSGLALGSPVGGGMGSYTIHPDETVGANCVITTYFNTSRPEQPVAPPKKK